MPKSLRHLGPPLLSTRARTDSRTCSTPLQARTVYHATQKKPKTRSRAPAKGERRVTLYSARISVSSFPPWSDVKGQVLQGVKEPGTGAGLAQRQRLLPRQGQGQGKKSETSRSQAHRLRRGPAQRQGSLPRQGQEQDKRVVHEPRHRQPN